jgi:preprotein translocase subunit SecE
VTALAVIRMTWQYWVLVVSFIVGGSLIFFLLSFLGQKLLQESIL